MREPPRDMPEPVRDEIMMLHEDGDPPADSESGKSWVPYEGPSGGEGWRSTEDPDDIRYTDDPPGETLTDDPEDNPLSEGDRVVLRYDGETHVGEVVAETPVDVRVRDDRNLWTLDKDAKDQYGGDMQVLNAGAPESDKRDPEAMDIEDADDLVYALNEADNNNDPDSFIAERILDSLDALGAEGAYEAVEESNQSVRVATYSLRNEVRGTTEDGREVTMEPTREEYNNHRDRLKEETDRFTHEDSAVIAAGWEGAMYRDPRTSPLIGLAMENTGNETLPEYRGADRAVGAHDGAEARSMKEISEFTTETLREAFGDEVTVFRGLSKNPHMGTPSTGTGIVERIERAVESGEDVEIEHRPAESWSLNPKTASLYADTSGVVIEASVPVEDVLMSSSAGTIDYSEDDTVVQHEGPETYGPDDIIAKGDMERKKSSFLMAASAAEGAQK